MTTSFAASVDAWVQATKERAEVVFKESAQRVVSEMQTPVGAGGNMPVDTGYLRASLTASTSSMPTLREGAAPSEGQKYTYDGGQIALVIAGADLGQTVYVGYVANYARHQEYGSNGRAGRGFVRLAAARWGQIVAEVTAEAKAAAG